MSTSASKVETKAGTAKAGRHNYVVVTPARNEAAFIELTLKSMVAQTVKPLKWVIVSDGSTDGTDEIVKRYSEKNEWIELLRMPERKERHFAGKVHAFNAGYARVKDLPYDFIASLDADLSFDEGYFGFLLGKFDEHPGLGLAGTPFREGEETYNYQFTSVEHVSGACQLFKRECFESIGGYVPLKVGGIDLTAVLTARKNGWKTRTFTEKYSNHHRKMGTANSRRLMTTFKGGYHDYLMGGHPVWQIFRSLYQMGRKPLVVGGSVLFAGYFWAIVKGEKWVVPQDLVKFRRTEQMQRLRAFLRQRFTGAAPKAAS